jgi:hypothetical protein
MKALKGLLIYIGMILGSALGLGLILLCIMLFVPSFRIAGVGVIRYTKEIKDEIVVLEDYPEYENIVINASSDKIKINVIPTEEENISYNMNLSVFGITTEIVEYQVVKHIEVVDGKLQIFFNVTEPNGWISIAKSALNIFVPESMKFGLVANTKSGSIKIGKDKISTQIEDLTISTRNGDLTLVNIGTGEEEKNLTLNTLTLSTGAGKFDFSSIDNLTVLNNVKLVADDGEFIFKNLFASMNITGNGIKINADNIACGINGFSFIADHGFFVVNSLSCGSGAENTIIAENISLDIGEITGKTGIVTTNGNINVGTFNSYTIIENYNGNITVETAKDTIIVKAHMGDIKVKSYYATGKFSNNKGDIIVNSRGEFVEEYYTEITNVDGNVKVKNEINRLHLTTTGRSDVIVAFGKIKTGIVFQHKIHTDTRGDCVVYMPTAGVSPYKFIAKGIISGELGKTVSASESVQYYPSDSNTNKAEAINNCNFEFVGRIEFKSHTRDDISSLDI